MPGLQRVKEPLLWVFLFFHCFVLWYNCMKLSHGPGGQLWETNLSSQKNWKSGPWKPEDMAETPQMRENQRKESLILCLNLHKWWAHPPSCACTENAKGVQRRLWELNYSVNITQVPEQGLSDIHAPADPKSIAKALKTELTLTQLPQKDKSCRWTACLNNKSIFSREVSQCAKSNNVTFKMSRL